MLSVWPPNEREDCPQVVDPSAQRLAAERARGLPAAAKIEPNRVVPLCNRPLTAGLVAAALVADEAVTADQPAVALGLVMHRDDSLALDGNLVSCRHLTRPR
ncbi:hypothetical protein [Halovenus sp. HT40]|uniref:hypothetical protein n=1 Tax=Halovenus sp. HT40 TaxID=3126691 RepID=UPI00300F2F49